MAPPAARRHGTAGVSGSGWLGQGWGALRVFLPASALLWLTLTIGAYSLGQYLQRRLRGNALANPVLIAIVLVGAVLHWSGTSYRTYFSGAQFLHFLLGPATVALAVPLVESWEHVRRSRGALVAGLIAGSGVSAISGYGLVRICGGTRAIALAMMPKSTTTPIAMAVAERAGGPPALTAVLAIAGGILVAICVQWLMRLVRVRDWRAYGFAAGTAGSGIGAAQVIGENATAGAFAGLAIGLNGLATAMWVPALLWLFRLVHA